MSPQMSKPTPNKINKEISDKYMNTKSNALGMTKYKRTMESD